MIIMKYNMKMFTKKCNNKMILFKKKSGHIYFTNYKINCTEIKKSLCHYKNRRQD